MKNLSGIVAAGFAACTLAAVSHSAEAAPTKAWTVAKANLPADTAVAIGVDTAAIARSSTFQKLFPIAISKNADAKDALDLVKSACKVDPLSIIKSAAVGLSHDTENGAVFITVTGESPAKLADCLRAVAKQKGIDKSDQMKVVTDGNITDLSSNDGKHIYFGWLAGDTVVLVPKHMESKDELKMWMGGGFAKGDLAKQMAKVNTNATIFVASAVGKSIDATHNMKNGFGWADLTGGKVAIEFHGVLGDAASAKGLADDANKQLDQLKKNPSALPVPGIANMIQTVTVTSAADELVAKATVAEQDLTTLITMALGG